MTRKQAIEASIKHWQDDYKRLEMFGGDEAFSDIFYSRNCALCSRYEDELCKGCPLMRGKTGCNSPLHPWYKAMVADEDNDTKWFLTSRRNIIARLKRALAKEPTK
jgi:hypothetical protein